MDVDDVVDPDGGSSAEAVVAEEDLVSYGRRLTTLAAERPTDVALVFVAASGAEEQVTWAALESRANRAARALAAEGLGEGSLLALALPNSVDHIVATFAGWKVGACVLPLRWDLPGWERDRVLQIADPTLVVVATDRADRPGEVPVGRLSDASLPTTPLPDVVARPARAIATSGSTGTPKIIVSQLPGEDVPGRSVQNASAVYLRYRPQQVQLIPAPLYHMNGFIVVHLGLFEGQGVILMERFDAALAVDLIERHRVNTLIVVPIMLQRMARLPDIDQRDLSSIESMVQGGSTLPHWLGHRWIELLGEERFYVVYGSSENAGVTIARGDEWLAHVGTVGRPLRCEVKILDPGGAEVPVGEVGEIYFRWCGQTDRSFEYRGGEARTRDDLFSSIGDLGHLDGDGYLYVVDRRTDMIVSGGANVYASEVEAALSDHPAVADVVVVGLPDAEWGQRVHAVVQVEPTQPEPTTEELRDHCRDRLAGYKVPKSVELVEALSRSDAGKIRRADYRRVEDGGEQGTSVSRRA